MNNQGEFTVEELKEQKKAENVWDKGMQSRRAVANATPGFVNILKLNAIESATILQDSKFLLHLSK